MTDSSEAIGYQYRLVGTLNSAWGEGEEDEKQCNGLSDHGRIVTWECRKICINNINKIIVGKSDFSKNAEETSGVLSKKVCPSVRDK